MIQMDVDCPAPLNIEEESLTQSGSLTVSAISAAFNALKDLNS
jgi:hypothetical protein